MYQTWQELLKQILEEPQEKQRIAHEIHVTPVTLLRWAQNVSKPRDDNMQLLLKAIPGEYSQIFTQLSAHDFPYVAHEYATTGNIVPELPPEFYARVLSAYANTPESLYPQAVYDLILQQALEHLDPDRRGMAISIVQCIPPATNSKIRSLREITGRGTPPWQRDLGQETIFLGAESLAGAAVMHCRQVMIPNRESNQTLFPAHWLEYEQSAAAYPLTHKAKIAGCVLVSSAQPYYFGEVHLKLIECYAHLLALAFEPEHFFALDSFQLHLMPPYTLQLPHLRQFNQLATQRFVEVAARHQPLTFQEAQMLVWQEIEDTLLRLSWPIDTEK